MESVVEKRLYEAMFLVDSAQAGKDWDAVVTTIKTVFERAEAEIVSLRKWDERKLVYEIEGKTRGTYILVFFRADGEKIQGIERDVRLSERIMRVLILNAESRKEEEIERPPVCDGLQTPTAEAEQAGAQQVEKAEELEQSVGASEHKETPEPAATDADEAGQPE